MHCNEFKIYDGRQQSQRPHKRVTFKPAGSHSDWSTGSQGSSASPKPRRKWQRGAMSMAKTLALIHVALVWSRQALTLSDLLR